MRAAFSATLKSCCAPEAISEMFVPCNYSQLLFCGQGIYRARFVALGECCVGNESDRCCYESVIVCVCCASVTHGTEETGKGASSHGHPNNLHGDRGLNVCVFALRGNGTCSCATLDESRPEECDGGVTRHENKRASIC